MRLTLEFSPTVAVLVVEDGGETVEVRGNPKVGSLFVGDRLDRVVSKLPKTVNISDLFADVTVNVRPDDAKVVRDALAWEEEVTRRMFASTYG